MPLKHIGDLELQYIAESRLISAEQQNHLDKCIKCRKGLEFYEKMFPLLSTREAGDFSPDFALDVVRQVTQLSERSKKIKSLLSFLLILLLSIIPFIIFPDSLSQISLMGTTVGKFFTFLRNSITDYNLDSWSVIAIILLLVLIQLFEFIMKHYFGKKQLR